MRTKLLKRYIFLIAATIFFSAHAYAQGAANPDELRLQIQKMIQNNNFKNLENYAHEDTKANSLNQLKSLLASFVGADELKVYVVAKQDLEAVKKMQIDTAVPGIPERPALEQRVKSIRDAGWIFDVEPIGDLMIVGKKVDPKSKGKSGTGSLYGVQNGRYVLVFARPK